MKKESLDAAIGAYDIEEECIHNMKNYFDEKKLVNDLWK